MTQAYNLSQLANNLDSSGRLDATDGLVNAVPVANGGTGAANATSARSNLGLGTIATQNANNVAITGGSVTGITDLAIADGGTGASTAADARTSLGVPSTTGSGASGTWGINITGNAATATTATVAANSLGVNQTWGDYTSSRTAGSTYTNSTVYAIYVAVNWTQGSTQGTGVLTVAGYQIRQSTVGGGQGTVQAIIPPGVSYSFTANNGGVVNQWYELR